MDIILHFVLGLLFAMLDPVKWILVSIPMVLLIKTATPGDAEPVKNWYNEHAYVIIGTIFGVTLLSILYSSEPWLFSGISSFLITAIIHWFRCRWLKRKGRGDSAKPATKKTEPTPQDYTFQSTGSNIVQTSEVKVRERPPSRRIVEILSPINGIYFSCTDSIIVIVEGSKVTSETPLCEIHEIILNSEDRVHFVEAKQDGVVIKVLKVNGERVIEGEPLFWIEGVKKTKKKSTDLSLENESTARKKLEELKSMFDDDLISREDYENKKSEILDRM